MALPLATLLLLISGASAWSGTPSSLVAKYAGAAGSAVRSRNGGDKLKGYTAYWSIDATAKKVRFPFMAFMFASLWMEPADTGDGGPPPPPLRHILTP